MSCDATIAHAHVTMSMLKLYIVQPYNRRISAWSEQGVAVKLLRPLHQTCFVCFLMFLFFSMCQGSNSKKLTKGHTINTRCWREERWKYRVCTLDNSPMSIQLGPYISIHFGSVHHHNGLEMKHSRCALSADFQL